MRTILCQFCIVDLGTVEVKRLSEGEQRRLTYAYTCMIAEEKNFYYFSHHLRTLLFRIAPTGLTYILESCCFACAAAAILYKGKNVIGFANRNGNNLCHMIIYRRIIGPIQRRI